MSSRTHALSTNQNKFNSEAFPLVMGAGSNLFVASTLIAQLL